MSTDYPAWVCTPCAEKAGGIWPNGHVGTFHNGICHVCGELKAVTEPRDFGYPKLKVNKNAVELSRQYYDSSGRVNGVEEDTGKC